MSARNHEIDSQAAEWAVKRDLGALTPEQQAAFEAWLAADIRHLGAYGRAEAVLGRLERFHSGAVEQVLASQPSRPQLWARRRVMMTGGIAAGLATFGIFGAAYWQSAKERIYTSGIGQVREIPLADGSLIVLNTNSRVAVRLTDKRREIHLVQGEALFEVAKDKQRPFIVTAGEMQVKAVGTAFTVSMLPERPIQVLVKEGVVELNRDGPLKSPPVRVRANTRALAAEDAPIVASGVAQSQLDRNLAWQFGRLAFDNETLQDAAEEFARYSDVRIVVDPAVSNRTITGLFVSNDPIGFAKGAARALKLDVEVGEREVRLSSRSDGAP